MLLYECPTAGNYWYSGGTVKNPLEFKGGLCGGAAPRLEQWVLLHPMPYLVYQPQQSWALRAKINRFVQTKTYCFRKLSWTASGRIFVILQLIFGWWGFCSHAINVVCSCCSYMSNGVVCHIESYSGASICTPVHNFLSIFSESSRLVDFLGGSPVEGEKLESVQCRQEIHANL